MGDGVTRGVGILKEVGLIILSSWLCFESVNLALGGIWIVSVRWRH